jgi:hypothetical protein
MSNSTEEIYLPLSKHPNYTNYSNYLVSNFGNIKNKKTNHILRGCSDKHNYKYYQLFSDDNKTKQFSCHRLVADLFIPNPDNKPQVNHIDSNKKNNHVDNLEWMTASENVKHAIKNGRKKGNTINKKVKIIDEDNITFFDSITDAANHYEVPKECLSLAMKKDNNVYKSNLQKGLTFKIKHVPDKYDENEIWEKINIDGYKHLEITKSGLIRNRKTKKTVIGQDDGRYIRIKGSVKIQQKSCALHRLIAQTFIENPENKPYINHKDGNTKNNCVDNLEWCTQSENVIHALDTGLMNPSHDNYYTRSILQLELNGDVIKEYDSISKAAKDINCKASLISNVCRDYDKDKYAVSFGYLWCYIENYKGKTIAKMLENIFPELVDREDIDYNVIRKYIVNNSRPIWQIDLDGTRIKQFDSIIDAARHLNVEPSNISITINNENLVCGYTFNYLTYEDMINTESHMIKNIPEKIKSIYNITDDNTFIHPKIINLLKQNIDVEGKLSINNKPVIQETTDGKFVKVYPNPTKAIEELKLSRQTVENVLVKKTLTAGGFRFRYLELDDIALDFIDNDNPNKIYISPLQPLPKKVKPVGKAPTIDIYQLELNGKKIREFVGFKAAGDWIKEKYNIKTDKPIHKPINASARKYRDGEYAVSNGYMWCYADTPEKKNYHEGRFGDKVYELFPDLKDYQGEIDYDIIRKYFMLKKKPIWQIALDGTRVKLFDSKEEAVEGLKNIKIESPSIGKCLKDSKFIIKGFTFRYATYEDLADIDNSYKIKNIPDLIKNIFNITNDNTIIHPKIVELLLGNVTSRGSIVINTPPIVHLSENDEFINVYPNQTIASKEIGLCTASILKVLRGEWQTAKKHKFRYLQLDDPILSNKLT